MLRDSRRLMDCIKYEYFRIISLTTCVFGRFRKLKLRFPTITILSDNSEAFSMDHSNFFQNELSAFGGLYTQQRRMLQVGSLISVHKQSVSIGSKFSRLEIYGESQMHK